MSGEVNGAVVILKIEDSGSPGTYNTLANQVDTTLNEGTTMADTSSKSHPNMTGKPVLADLGISCSYMPDPTDQAHIDLLDALDNRTSILVEAIREDGTGKYAGSYYVAEAPSSNPNTDVSRRSVTLTPAGTITVT